MWLRFAFLASLLTPFLHIIVLFMSGQDAVSTPIGELSRADWGVLHTIELVLFGAAHVAFAIGLAGLDRGRLWPYGRLLLVASGGVLVYIAYFFSTADVETLRGPEANDPLWIVATLTGIAMGALQPGLARLSRQLGVFSVICFGIWLWLIPLILLVNDSWIGAYERLVGIVYVTWMMGLTLGLSRLAEEPSDD
ncbi:MAG: DUF998 domain-containing protein [Woeseiaceae bacterium]|nr:DUF998 domain-containing protein [Woeseiaceae bacterium]